MRRATFLLALGLAGCAGGNGEVSSEAVPSIPSRSEARQAVWNHVRFTVDAAAGKPRVISGCYTEARSVTCAVDYERSCRLFAVTRVGGTLNIGAPGGTTACLHVSGALTTRFDVDP